MTDPQPVAPAPLTDAVRDRLFWLAVRRALKAVIAAIEQRFGIGKAEP